MPVTRPVQHAEGPHWDVKEQALYYVDTFTATVHKWEHNERKCAEFKLEHDSVGIIIPIKNERNRFLVGSDTTLYFLSWEPGAKAVLQEVVRVDNGKSSNQFNDGKVDCEGRLWIGTLTRNADLSVEPFGGSLFCVKGKGVLAAERKLADVSISNGLAWSKDNSKFFFVDSDTRKIDAFDFNSTVGSIENRRTIFDLESHPELRGLPDGMTIDTEDNLWVALFGGKSVINVDSRTGQLLQVIAMPVTYVTSLAFGGPEMKTLYATSSKLKLSEEDLKSEPMAGSVFAIFALNVAGLPANEYALS